MKVGHFKACFNNNYGLSYLSCIIHQDIWLWTRRLVNGGGSVPVYVEQTIYETTQSTGKCRSD